MPTFFFSYPNCPQMSNFSEKDQVIFLLRGLVHTAKKTIDKHRLPTPLAVFAAKALIIQTDPLHCLYPKVNEFLLQGPTWEASKVPLFQSILLREPKEDDSYYKEVAWMIDNLKSGLSTPEVSDL
jgi:nucleolar pre-ribosomal-associated protein 1